MSRLVKLLSVCFLSIIFLAGLVLAYSRNIKSISKNTITVPTVQAASSDTSFVSVTTDAYGYAWSENIGWISFNSKNCDTNNDGKSEGGAGCPIAGTNVSAYGVNLDLVSGSPTYDQLSGYAWSENIGWISFNPADWGATCPPGANCQPRLVGSDFSGWARALANGGGWDGWISLNCANSGACAANNYKVSLSGTDFTGWAWGSDVIGWLSFNGANIGGPISYNYKVYLTNTPPTISNLTTNKDSINYCIDSFLGINLSWTFTDPDPADINQTAYKLKITRSDGAVYDPGIKSSTVPLVSGSYIQSILPGFLRYNPSGTETYSWEVTAYDSVGASDGPKSGPSFYFTQYQYPSVNFSPPSPNTFVVNLPIQFCSDYNFGPCSLKTDQTNKSLCYDSGSPALCPATGFIWDFGDQSTNPFNPLEDIKPNPSHTYTVSGSYNIELNVTDGLGHRCSNLDSVGTKNLGAARLKWKEIAPK